MFHLVKIYKYTDYGQLLLNLEEKGYVSSRPSQNLIASIDKKFQITPEAVKLCPFLRDYVDHFYEADCLGTELHRTLTILLEDVCQLLTDAQSSTKEKCQLETDIKCHLETDIKCQLGTDIKCQLETDIKCQSPNTLKSSDGIAKELPL